MSIDRDNDGERKARVEALLREARLLRGRAKAAKTRACELVADSEALMDHQSRWKQRRTALLRLATDAVKIAKAGSPTRFRIPIRGRKKTA
jgi:hypothetical protein